MDEHIDGREGKLGDQDISRDEDDETPPWAKQLKRVGKHYFSGLVENIDQLLELHKRSTLCSFGTRTSVVKCRDGDSENDTQV